MSGAPSPRSEDSSDVASHDASHDASDVELASFDAELRRLVDRLRAMRVEALIAAADTVREALGGLLRLSADLGDEAPSPLVHLRPTALGDQLAVIGSDLRTMAVRRNDCATLEAATEVLITLRRDI